MANQNQQDLRSYIAEKVANKRSFDLNVAPDRDDEPPFSQQNGNPNNMNLDDVHYE